MNTALINRFIGYTKHDTQSMEESSTFPSVPEKLLPFANVLKAELESEGMQEVNLDEKGYLYATLPATPGCENVPVIGFISHYDTSPDCSGANIKARIVENYNGKDIVLSEGIVTTVEKFPELLLHVGEDLIVTDGHTLLGADDKAGVAEMIQAMVWLREHPEVKHGKIRVGFTPDEEVGHGADFFDVERFGCQWGYTVDGGDLGELEYENFNAASAKVNIKGTVVHTGYAKGKLINACLLASEFIQMLPANERPETTEGYEGFFALLHVNGGMEEAQLTYLIRDFDPQNFEQRKSLFPKLAEEMNKKYGEGTVTVSVNDSYFNMKEIIDQHPHTVEICLEALKKLDITPKVMPIRGGTDGARLSFVGLPCPNIFAGGVNFHGRHEFVSCQVMDKAMMTIVNICSLTAKRYANA